MANSADTTEDFLESERGNMNPIDVVRDDLAAAEGLANVGASASDVPPKPEEEAGQERSEWMDILGSGQINKKVLIEGKENSQPQRGDVCIISYEGKLKDGTVVEKVDGYQVNLGDAEIIQGLDLVLALMNEGEKAVVEIGPRFAYGTAGRDGISSFPPIPADQTLTYTVELKAAHPEPPMEEIPISERKRIGNKKRERGNWWYGRHEHSVAINCYRRALDYLDEAVGGITVESDNHDAKDEEALKELLEDRIKVYNNLAAAQLKLGALDAGLSSLNNVLRCQPDNIKAIFRKAKILSGKGDVVAAIDCLQKASLLVPDNKVVKAELHALRSKAKEATQQEKKLYRKMLGGTESESRTMPDQEREGHSRSKLVPWGMVVGSVAVVLAGMVAYRYKYI